MKTEEMVIIIGCAKDAIVMALEEAIERVSGMRQKDLEVSTTCTDTENLQESMAKRVAAWAELEKALAETRLTETKEAVEALADTMYKISASISEYIEQTNTDENRQYMKDLRAENQATRLAIKVSRRPVMSIKGNRCYYKCRR